MIDLQVLTSYSFLLIALATFLLASVAGAMGTISVLKGQSLIGDAIGHAAYPGVVLAFMLTMERNPVTLLLGAITSGALGYLVIQVINRYSKIDLDVALAVVLSSFFGFGMVLKSYIQGNAAFAGSSQSGLKNYIFGQAAYIMEEDVLVILLVALLSFFILLAFYKELKLYIFDEAYAKIVGYQPEFINLLVLLMTMSLIGVGLKLVGTILIASLLIVPPIIALQWTHRFSHVLVLSGLVGGLSAIVGTYYSTIYQGVSTGPAIIVAMSCLALFSFIISPKGIIRCVIGRGGYRG